MNNAHLLLAASDSLKNQIFAERQLTEQRIAIWLYCRNRRKRHLPKHMVRNVATAQRLHRNVTHAAQAQIQPILRNMGANEAIEAFVMSRCEGYWANATLRKWQRDGSRRLPR